MNITKEVGALERMTVKQLRAKYVEAFGEATNANNKMWLIKRVAWRLQALAEGMLSERARQRAAELANDADLRLAPPKRHSTPVPAERTQTAILRFQGDHRIPPPGSVITRVYKGVTLQIKVLANGFEFEGETFKSLSAVAKAITGQHCNGFHFFRIAKEVGK